MIYGLLRKALFQAPPELAHDLALQSLKLGQPLGATRLLACARDLPTRVLGMDFPNPVGLAAGLDKNGDYIDALGSLGFGFLEIGTVTPRPQPGNPKPRIFRIPEQQAIVNRLGFNNKGVDYLVQQVKKRRWNGILGINIGRNKDTPEERAVDDYLHCLDRVHAHADYITINISSPNTQGLRDLQSVERLAGFLQQLRQRGDELDQALGRAVPLLVKVAPDLVDGDIAPMATAIHNSAFDGVICTNTTIARPGVEGNAAAAETGGLSGAPLKPQADHVLGLFRQALGQDVPIIGLGGITQGQDAVDKLTLGASLVQVYTGFIYRGPALIGEAVRAMSRQRAEKSQDASHHG